MPYHDRKKRIRIEKEVLINGLLICEGLDLSEDGIYVYTAKPFLKDTDSTVSIKLDETKLTFMARIIHTQPGIGFGAEFKDVSDSLKEKVRKYIEKNCK